jgi:hypothetical protein
MGLRRFRGFDALAAAFGPEGGEPWEPSATF